MYLLVNTVVILLGSLVLTGLARNTAAFAVGTSLVATGVAGLVTFFYIRLNEDTTKRLNVLANFGLIDAFEKRGFAIESEYNQLLAKASHNVDIIGFGLSSFLADYKDVFESWKQRFHVRILLIDPDCPEPHLSFAHQREIEEGIPPDSMRKDVEKFISETRDLLGDGKHGSFSIRLYRCLPAVNIFRIDDHLFWGPYLSKQLSRSSPTFLVRNGTLFGILLSHFDRIWEDDKLSRPVP